LTASNWRAWLVPRIGLLIGVMVVLGASATQGDAATLLKGSFRGHAWATFANAKAGPVATTLGRSAFQPCPCKGTNGKTLSNTITSVATTDEGRTFKAGVTLSTVMAKKETSSALVKNISKVTGLRAFDVDGVGGEEPLITAKAIKAVANTSANASTIKSTPEGSKFVNLKIAGQSINADVPANRKVDLPGVGHVILKSVRKSGDGERLGKITVEMLTVVVTEETNTFGLPVGSRIVVAHAVSGYSRTDVKAELGGHAYAAQALTTTNLIKNRVGRAALVVLGCEGTSGKVRTNNVNSLDVGQTLSSGTGTTSAYGKQLATGGVARTTATVEDLSLLSGLITADAVKAVAQDKVRGGNRTSSTEGSRFVNLKVGETSVAIEPAPNTRLPLPGIGYVIVNEQQVPSSPTSAVRVKVNGLRVVIRKDNILGLPVGTQIVVANAEATAVR
jgi:hypothetical protein